MKNMIMKCIKNIFSVSLVIFIMITIIVYIIIENKDIDDNDFYKQWYLDNTGNIKQIVECNDRRSYEDYVEGIDINIRETWELFSKNGFNDKKEVIVAVIDTGVDFEHEDLSNVMWKSKDDSVGYDFVNKKNINKNSIGVHGTMCAGIIAAKKNGKGIQGVASNINIKIMSLNVLQTDEETSIEIDNVIKAIDYAERHGAKICNLSFNITHNNSRLYKTIKNSKMLFVVSAGNESKGINIDTIPYYPATYDCDNIITVANAVYSGRLELTSNYGLKNVDVAAPGTCMFSTTIGNSYMFGTGTSLATPVVSGIAAIIFAAGNQETSAEEVKKSICASCSPMKSMKNKIKYNGMVNSYDALKYYMSHNSEEVEK